MKRDDLTIGKYYTVRFGQWTDLCLLCSIDRDKARVAIARDSWWRIVPLSSILSESPSPGEQDAIASAMREEARLSIDAMLAENDRKSLLAPPRYPHYQEPMITKQGTVCRLGDYGT